LYLISSVNPLIGIYLNHTMILKLISIVLIVLGLFALSLLISYEGFQVSPNLRAQQLPFDNILSTCTQMESILQSHDISYEQMIRMINNNQIKSYFNPGEINTIEQCLQGRLPKLSSYLVPQKI